MDTGLWFAMLGRLVEEAVDAFSVPDLPSPSDIRHTAQSWTKTAEAADGAAGLGGGVVTKLDPTQWAGQTADAFRSSATAHAGRVSTVGAGARSVAGALDDYAFEVEQANAHYRDALASLAGAVVLMPIPNPADIAAGVGRSLTNIGSALNGLDAARQQVVDAAHRAERRIRPAIDSVALPDRTAPGLSAVETIDGWKGNTSGPLRGSVMDRAAAKLDAMSPQDRARVQQILDGAGDPPHKSWILAALAGGADVATLTNFANRIAPMSDNDLARLDPLDETDNFSTRGAFREANSTFWLGPDVQMSGQIQCGPDSLVMADMINDPVYALQILTGYDAQTGVGPTTGPVGGPAARERFLGDVQKTFDAISNPIDQSGRPQSVIPQSSGSSPSEMLNSMDHLGRTQPGMSPDGYRWLDASTGDRNAQFDQISTAASHGDVMPIFVGNDDEGKHVSLITGTDGPDLTYYSQNDGSTQHISRDQYVNGQMDADNWNQPKGTLVPKGG